VRSFAGPAAVVECDMHAVIQARSAFVTRFDIDLMFKDLSIQVFFVAGCHMPCSMCLYSPAVVFWTVISL
jgi:hypothetical protein